MLQVTIKSFSYSEKEILKNISFQLERGSHLVVLGESGCGKSTLLHIIYGLLHLDQGSLHWDAKPLLGPKHNLIPGEEFMKLVAQEFNVMPYITVEENIASHLSRMDIEKDSNRVSELLKVVDLEEFSGTMVKNLSGGQKQRVALAKALAKTPQLLLLDEPFSNIDTFRKSKLRRDLFSYLKENNISCITATHDSQEALSYADSILMLRNGSVEAMAPPEELYNNVKTTYQAGFFDEVNILPSSLFHGNSEENSILFPHQLQVSTSKTNFEAVVKKSYFKGSYYLILSDWKGRDVFFENDISLIKGQKIQLSLK